MMRMMSIKEEKAGIVVEGKMDEEEGGLRMERKLTMWMKLQLSTGYQEGKKIQIIAETVAKNYLIIMMLCKI